MPRSQCEKENVQLVQELAEVDGPFESPINLNFRDLIKLELPSLTWNKPDAVPKKMKITNTGHTVIVNGKWKCERPYLTGGPLDGKYVFSQIHFHWGPDNCKGSEHQVCGESFPLEMHVAHFKTEYMTQESALREKDGMVVLVYLFKLQDEPNNSLKKIINALPCIKQANSSQPLECRSILALCNPFTDDYFMYWGSVVTSTCAHILLWIVCREPFGISRDQMEEFRKILDSSQHPIRRNSREPQPLHKRNVFHVNASKHLDQPMLPIRKIVGCFCLEDTKNSEGDPGGCSCATSNGPQEELEGSQNLADHEKKCEAGNGNGAYLQQRVYYQHQMVQSVPVLCKQIEDFLENSSDLKSREISQSCCFMSIEEKSLSDEVISRERIKDRRKKAIDSVTTLANLIDTLETLKTQMYKKLKEIENINHDIRDMKSSCENLEEKNWLRHVEKIMSKQKRYTIRSSQCCFNELKKLAKECHFDRLMDDNLLIDDKILSKGSKQMDTSVLGPNASADKIEIVGLERMNSNPINVYNSEKFSRKAQNLIRSFFEDINDSEEAQMNIEKTLFLKKLEKLSKRKSDVSNASSANFPVGQMYITKNMMNQEEIRDQFFTEIPVEENAVSPAETKIVPAVKKKKTKSFFKISFNCLENQKSDTTRKSSKRSIFKKSALAWINSRINTLHDSSPVIPLRITDIELKTGSIISRNKSKQSIKAASIRKVISEERVRTEISSYISESIISELSDKQSRYSKQSRTHRSIMRDMEGNTETKGEMSLVRVIEDLDTNGFVKLTNSANMSSGTSCESERRGKIIRRSRKDLWEDGSSMLSGYRKDISKQAMYYANTTDLTEHIIGKSISSSADSTVIVRENSKAALIILESRKSAKSGKVNSRDVSVDATKDVSEDSPRRKKQRLERKIDDVVHTRDLEPDNFELKTQTVSYVESECQADIRLFNKEKMIYAQTEDMQENCVSAVNSIEKCDALTEMSDNSFRLDSVNETGKESPEVSPRSITRDSSVKMLAKLPTLQESEREKVEIKSAVRRSACENEISDITISADRSQETITTSGRDLLFTMQRDTLPMNIHNNAGIEEIMKLSRREGNFVVDKKDECKLKDVDIFTETLNSNKPSETAPSTDVCTDVSQAHVHSEYFPVPSSLPNSSYLLSDDQSDKKTEAQIGDSNSRYESEYTSLFTVQEIEKNIDLPWNHPQHQKFLTSQNISQALDVSLNGVSKCNEYYSAGGEMSDSNVTRQFNKMAKLPSTGTTPSLPSSDDDKLGETSITSSVQFAPSQNTPALSCESFKYPKNLYEMKTRKRKYCLKKKSKQSIKKNSVVKKLNKIGSSNLDFTNLTEEEQLKKISANVAKFVKQKLVEHKHFFDFDRNEQVSFDIDNWAKPVDRIIASENNLAAEPVATKITNLTQVVIDNNDEDVTENVIATEQNPVLEEKPVGEKMPVQESKSVREERTMREVKSPRGTKISKYDKATREATTNKEKKLGLPVHEEEPSVSIRNAVREQEPTPTQQISPPPSRQANSSITGPRKGLKTKEPNVPDSENAAASNDQALSTAVETVKDDKIDPNKQTLDFIKLNKIMAGKYKRRTGTEPLKSPAARKTMQKGKNLTEVKKETGKIPILKPVSTNKENETFPKDGDHAAAEVPSKVENPKQNVTIGRGFRAPSADSARRPELRKKSDIPVPKNRDKSGSPTSTNRINPRSVSVSPLTRIQTPAKTITPTSVTLQKSKQPKKRLIPTYTLTSYLTTPSELIGYQQRELDKYLNQRNDFAEFLVEESKGKSYKSKKNKKLTKKNLDYLIMLQKRINHEISSNIENSMNYVKTLLSQDYNGSAIIEKAPVKNNPNVLEQENGIVLIEMNDQFDYSSSSSEFSEESGFYCIYQEKSKKSSPQEEAIVKRNESGDSGLVESRIFEELQNDTDSTYNCEVSITVNSQEDAPLEKQSVPEVDDVSDILKKYVYDLSGREEPLCLSGKLATDEDAWNSTPHVKKKKERLINVSTNIKKNMLRKEPGEKMKCRDSESDSTTQAEETESSDSSSQKTDNCELGTTELISKIPAIVIQYLDEYDRKQNVDDGYTEAQDDGTDYGEKLPDFKNS